MLKMKGLELGSFFFHQIYEFSQISNRRNIFNSVSEWPLKNKGSFQFKVPKSLSLTVENTGLAVLQKNTEFNIHKLSFAVVVWGAEGALCDEPKQRLQRRLTFTAHSWKSKGLFTRYDFVACDKLTTGLRHELFHVNQTYNSLTTPKSCRRPVVRLSHVIKSYRVNRP